MVTITTLAQHTLRTKHLSCGGGGGDKISAAVVVGRAALPLLRGLIGYVLQEEGL